VPFTPGRTDASQEQTDVASFAVLEPDRRRLPQLLSERRSSVPEALLVDKAQLLT
jgi:catalase-peroxidase